MRFTYAARAWRVSPRVAPLFALILALLVSSCGANGPRTLVAGEDACAYCRMEITDPRFGAQVITQTGRIHVFDSVECAAAFVRGNAPESIASVWVADLLSGTFVAAESAGFLSGSETLAPMGRTIAFADASTATQEQLRRGGTRIAWAALVADTASVHGVH